LRETHPETDLMTNEILLTVFVAMTGIALMVQAIVVVSFCLFAKKNYDKMRQDLDDLRESAVPFLKASREALTTIAPHIEPMTTDVVKAAASFRAISVDVADITAKLRIQVDGAQASTTEILDRVRQQAARVDTMVTSALDVIDRLGILLQSAMNSPARRVFGMFAAGKAIMDSLRGPKPVAHTVPAANDNETFI
jgi:uncharacterized protein YoxC